MSKKEKFCDIIQHQFNIKLENDKDNIFNKKRNILYTYIDKKNKLMLLSYFDKKNINYNEHINGFYWIEL